MKPTQYICSVVLPSMEEKELYILAYSEEEADKLVLEFVKTEYQKSKISFTPHF
jgi:hypothetical protein